MPSERVSWTQALAVYTRPRVLAMLFLGFSAGLPFLLVFGTLSAWLTMADVSRAAIGFFSWVGLMYSIKIFWAPVVDRLPLPGLTRLFGHRRGWMLLAQAGIAAGIVGMALTDPATELWRMAGFALLTAFSSATQDISIDAWRIEAEAVGRQGAMAAAYQAGYRVAMLASGAGALVLAANIPWSQTYLLMAAMVAVGMGTVLAISEPQRRVSRETFEREQRVVAFLERSAHWPARLRRIVAWLIGAVVCPLLDVFARYGHTALVIFALVGLYRVCDLTMGVMANPFYLDTGYSLEQIAAVSKTFGVAVTIAGAAIGGLLVARYGIMPVLLAGAILAAASNLLFAVLATLDPNLAWLTLAISADNLSGGIAGSAFIAWLSSLTSSAYTATQYALFSSLMTLPGKFIGGFSGLVVAGQGYFTFFMITTLAGLPAVLLTVWLMRRQQPAAP